tara:strand:+ start:192 stop:1055 length:864 start_codon:yes stop_codon:yes gene_type:complete
MEHYRINGTTIITFSGGRTSGFLLHKILENYNGKLPSDAHVVFDNTGKEMPQTLDFVNDCQNKWDVKIHWLEFVPNGELAGFKEVTYETASRNGEPFEKVIDFYTHRREQNETIVGNKALLPNPIARYCTRWLKENCNHLFMKSKGHMAWDMTLGLRYDEPRRVARVKNKDTRNRIHRTPLYDDKVTVEMVNNFWRLNDFDLELPVVNNETIHGNCDLCFLKSNKKMQYLIKENPQRAEWWSEQEIRTGTFFRKDKPSYQKLIEDIKNEDQMSLFDDEDLGDCFCHD